MEQGTQTTPGWYPDPWAPSQYRYWSGEAWTADTFPAVAGQPPPPPQSDAPTVHADQPDPPAWNVPTPEPTVYWTPPPTDPTPLAPPPSKKLSGGQVTAIAVVAALIIGIIAGAITGHSRRHTVALSPSATLPTPASPQNPQSPQFPPATSAPAARPTDPNANVLDGLVARQADVSADDAIAPLQGGEDTSQPTLDLCNGTFPSESQRTARLQVSVIDSQLNDVFSTEAVLYGHAGGTAQAFTELRSVATSCPTTPVNSPVGEPTITTKFNAAPDGSWPATPTVDRLAFDFLTADETGTTNHSVAVYLRRGRVLMGLYFSHPDGPQAAIDGKTSIPDIVSVFAGRMAALPAGVVNA